MIAAVRCPLYVTEVTSISIVTRFQSVLPKLKKKTNVDEWVPSIDASHLPNRNGYTVWVMLECKAMIEWMCLTVRA